MKRKAEDVLVSLENAVQRDIANRVNGSPRQLKAPKQIHFEAQKALMDDLLVALPEKGIVVNPDNTGTELPVIDNARTEARNKTIDQMEQAIRSYFGQTKGKGE